MPGSKPSIFVTYKGKDYYIKDIAERSGASYNTAASRMKRYKKGKSTIETLMKKSVQEKKGQNGSCAKWEGLTSKRRDENLDKIPRPTAIEERIFGELPPAVDGSSAKMRSVK